MLRLWRAALARLGIRTPYGRDAFVAVVLLVPALLALTLTAAFGPLATPVALFIGILGVADLGAIAVRRRAPLIALGAATAASVLGAAVPEPYSNAGIGILVASYAVGAYLPRRDAVTALAVAAGASAVGSAVVTTATGVATGTGVALALTAANIVPEAVSSIFGYGVPGLLGAYVQTRRAYTAELVARAERNEREREERAARAVTEERNRIARELHDVAAHHLSAIIVQAGAADRLVERDPAAAHAALEGIRAQGRETLTALRQLVGIMRATDADTDGRAPQPTLARLDRLVVDARDSGMAVEVTMSGPDEPLPPAVDLAAYRVVQEALSNARRHAPGAAATVGVTRDAGAVEVAVRNGPPPEGWSTAPPAEGEGYGLVGMRERVQQAGGTLSVGATRDGGWQVTARFPAAAAAAGPPSAPVRPAPPHPSRDQERR